MPGKRAAWTACGPTLMIYRISLLIETQGIKDTAAKWRESNADLTHEHDDLWGRTRLMRHI